MPRLVRSQTFLPRPDRGVLARRRGQLLPLVAIVPVSVFLLTPSPPVLDSESCPHASSLLSTDCPQTYVHARGM